MYKYFVVHSALMVQSLLDSEKKPDVYDLAIAEGIKEMLVMHGFTRDKILNTTVSNLAETLHIDYYVALNRLSISFPAALMQSPQRRIRLRRPGCNEWAENKGVSDV